jgi:hypothetical protein
VDDPAMHRALLVLALAALPELVIAAIRNAISG